jgi:hypothetical protein
MDYREKLFVSRKLADNEIPMLANLLKRNKIKEKVVDNFVYIHFNTDESVEIVSVPNDMAKDYAKDLNVSLYQAVVYSFHEFEYEQAAYSLLYWSSIGGYKKYAVVIAEAKMKHGISKVYADFSIYARDEEEAQLMIDEVDFDEYLYLEDVDA